mmetsp:Transcript_127020/g.340847  ORF Transcript_127020/g.340847 Transcript_127020/m.340847 type:complete len:424 (+) Transcript_127020:643-1914(+)
MSSRSSRVNGSTSSSSSSPASPSASPSFLSSAPSSPSFFSASSAFFTGGGGAFFFQLEALSFHSDSCLFHAAHFSLNHSEGSRPSTLCVLFCSSTHARSVSAQADASCQAYLTSSNPSASPGREKSAKDVARALLERSGTGVLRCHCAFSSAVSSTGFSASSSSFASSFGSSFASSFASLGSSPSCGAASLSAGSSLGSSFFASTASCPGLEYLACFALRHSSSSLSLFVLAFSFSAAATFSDSSCACTFSLYSFDGSPMTTTATRLKSLAGNRASSFFRSAARRLSRSSSTMKSRLRAGVTAASVFCTLMSSIMGTPNCMPGLSLEALFPRLWRPLFEAHSRTFRSLSSKTLGLASRNWSAQANTPWSGRPRGTSTSRLLSAAGPAGSRATSSADASLIIRHLNGSGFFRVGPKFTCNVTFL